jgi:hypothetical protein
MGNPGVLGMNTAYLITFEDLLLPSRQPVTYM